MDLFDYRDGIRFLNDLLDLRIEQRPSYSIRTLAKSLGFSASELSSILRGHKKLSRESARAIARKLFKEHSERTHFELICLTPGMRSESRRKALLRQLAHLKKAPPKAVPPLARQWYHAAILCLMDCGERTLDPVTLGALLGIDVPTAKKAVSELLRSRIIRKDLLGRYCRVRPTAG